MDALRRRFGRVLKLKNIDSSDRSDWRQRYGAIGFSPFLGCSQFVRIALNKNQFGLRFCGIAAVERHIDQAQFPSRRAVRRLPIARSRRTSRQQHHKKEPEGRLSSQSFHLPYFVIYHINEELTAFIPKKACLMRPDFGSDCSPGGLRSTRAFVSEGKSLFYRCP